MITSTIFWEFVLLNFINVLVNTARSLMTIKGGKWMAAVANAICYGYYTLIIVITATYEIPILYKCVAVAVVNFVGVFTIKLCEEKLKKPSLWIYNVIGVNNQMCDCFSAELTENNIPFINTHIKRDFNNMQVFSENEKESTIIVELLDNFKVKYYATEAKEKNSKLT